MAYNFYGGISEQNFCCLHPVEYEAVYHWVNIYGLTQYDYEQVDLWNAYWFTLLPFDTIRRGVFESTYGFIFTQEVNPMNGELMDVIKIGNYEYFDYLVDWIIVNQQECFGCSLASWP